MPCGPYRAPSPNHEIELYMLTMSVSGATAMAALKALVCVTANAVWYPPQEWLRPRYPRIVGLIEEGHTGAPAASLSYTPPCDSARITASGIGCDFSLSGPAGSIRVQILVSQHSTARSAPLSIL
jgi:hypothetical protein